MINQLLVYFIEVFHLLLIFQLGEIGCNQHKGYFFNLLAIEC